MNLKNAIQWLLLASFFPSNLGWAVERSASDVLPFESLEVEINGSRSLIAREATLEVVRGDLFIVLSGWFKAEANQSVDTVDILGYAPKLKANQSVNKTKDDRTYVVDTSMDLQAKFALDVNKSEFEIQGFSKGVLVARKVLHILEPRLDSVQISLNGKSMTLKNGDTLKLDKTDMIAVQQVLTNVRGNENVTHELKVKKLATGKQTRELIFARSGIVFGRIPIQWQE